MTSSYLFTVTKGDPVTDRIRVKAKADGVEYTTPAHLFNENAHVRLDKPAVDVRGEDIPAKYPTSIASAVETKRGQKAEKESV